ncbi:hypothetical protein AB0F42_05095 [Streptomyces buecherae]|uniref:hypothetical protein n=1 Tax=Streptomyces buecherae TaxID=2763006 RepID=UPI0033FDCA26
MALHRRIGRLGPAAVTLAALAGLSGTIALTATAAPPAGPGRHLPTDDRTGVHTGDVPTASDGGPHAGGHRGMPRRMAPSGGPVGAASSRATSAP